MQSVRIRFATTKKAQIVYNNLRLSSVSEAVTIDGAVLVMIDEWNVTLPSDMMANILIAAAGGNVSHIRSAMKSMRQDDYSVYLNALIQLFYQNDDIVVLDLVHVSRLRRHSH